MLRGWNSANRSAVSPPLGAVCNGFLLLPPPSMGGAQQPQPVRVTLS
ncbi:hypothetical protein [Dyella sp. Tek66A03]